MTRVAPPGTIVVVVTDRMVPFARIVVPLGSFGHAFEVIVNFTGDVSIFGGAAAADAVRAAETKPDATRATVDRFMCSPPCARRVE
jgi:class 3 adenylate cyclase